VNTAEKQGAAADVTAWTIAGAGMLMSALTFQRLATRRPDLDAGIRACLRVLTDAGAVLFAVIALGAISAAISICQRRRE
jgi:amino acid transporter